MIQGIGIDITEIARVRRASQQTAGFVTRILTPAELAIYRQYTARRRQEFLAGRFSAKESFSKAWGTGIGAISFQDLSILNDQHGRPYVEQQIYPGKVWISISHTVDYVFTEVILEKRVN